MNGGDEHLLRGPVRYVHRRNFATTKLTDDAIFVILGQSPRARRLYLSFLCLRRVVPAPTSDDGPGGGGQAPTTAHGPATLR